MAPILVFADGSGLGTFDDVGTTTPTASGSNDPQPNPFTPSSLAAAQNFFCTPKEYLTKRPDVKTSGMDVGDHFAKYGRGEHMCYPRLCSNAEYLRLRPDVAASGISPHDHYVSNGLDEGMCDPTGIGQRIPDGVFNSQACTSGDYLSLRPDVKNSNQTVAGHYLAFGKNEGMCIPAEVVTDAQVLTATAAVTCTPAQYLAQRPDVARANMSAVDHYNKSGKAEGMCDPIGN